MPQLLFQDNELWIILSFEPYVIRKKDCPILFWDYFVLYVFACVASILSFQHFFQYTMMITFGQMSFMVEA